MNLPDSFLCYNGNITNLYLETCYMRIIGTFLGIVLPGLSLVILSGAKNL